MADTPNEEFRKLMRTYAGFQMATALVVTSKFGEFWCASAIVALFAISIPSTLAYPSFARIRPQDENRNPAPVMAFCFIFAFFPSVAAISILLASASVFAAFAFPFTCIAWCLVAVILRHQGNVNLPADKKRNIP